MAIGDVKFQTGFGPSGVAVEATAGGASVPLQVPGVVTDAGIVPNRSRRSANIDSVAPLAISGVFTGVARDLGAEVSQRPLMTTVRVFADQAGTVFIDQSTDGVVWRSAVGESQAIGAGETRQLTIRIIVRYWRVRYVNGAIIQLAMELLSGTSEA